MKTKTCSACNTDKPTSDFRRDANRNDGYQSRCKTCSQAAYIKAYGEKYYEKARARNKRVSTANRKLVTEYKVQRGCALCPEREPVCLEFHHHDPAGKEFGISYSMSLSMDLLWKEIEKCVVLCSNCHKKVHANKALLV